MLNLDSSSVKKKKLIKQCHLVNLTGPGFSSAPLGPWNEKVALVLLKYLFSMLNTLLSDLKYLSE